MAAYERSITRAQKIQLESLQRQLKVQQSLAPSLHVSYTILCSSPGMPEARELLAKAIAFGLLSGLQ